MKRERAIVEHRRNQILNELKKNGQIKVELLAKDWNVTPLTIRRDLQYLEEQDKIERFYGGAQLLEKEKEENAVRTYCELIAQYAASLVEDGDSIFLNTSGTALKVVKYLGEKRVTVITNNGRIMNMDVPPNISVLLSGGELRYPKYAMVGEFALKNLENFTVKKSFVGCSGLSVEKGMTTEIMNEVHLNCFMLEQVTGEAYILADHRKIGHNSSFVSREIDGIHNLITDERAPEEVIRQLKEKNISVHQVRK